MNSVSRETRGYKMQSLQTTVTTRNLNEILATIETLPTADITRYDDVITVYATRKATGERVKVLSAVTSDSKNWHVMTTLTGLLTRV